MYAEIELEMTKDKYVHKFSVLSDGVHLAQGHFRSHHNVYARMGNRERQNTEKG